MLSGKISCCISPEFWSRPSSFSTKTDSYMVYILVTKIYKIRAMKISLFSYSMLGYITLITTSLPHFYRRNSCPTQIFKPTHQTRLQASSQPGIFRHIYHYLGPLLISATRSRSNFLYNILQQTRFPCCQP